MLLTLTLENISLPELTFDTVSFMNLLLIFDTALKILLNFEASEFKERERMFASNNKVPITMMTVITYLMCPPAKSLMVPPFSSISVSK